MKILHARSITTQERHPGQRLNHHQTNTRQTALTGLEIRQEYGPLVMTEEGVPTTSVASTLLHHFPTAWYPYCSSQCR